MEGSAWSMRDLRNDMQPIEHGSNNEDNFKATYDLEYISRAEFNRKIKELESKIRILESKLGMLDGWSQK